MELDVHADADFAEPSLDRHSVSGVAVMSGGMAVIFQHQYTALCYCFDYRGEVREAWGGSQARPCV